jgi:hypothetical protein
VTADAALVCRPAILDDAGSATGSADAGDAAAAALGEWRDFAANACVACPSREIFCDDLGGPQATFDFATGALRLNLSPGVAEVVSGTIQLDLYAIGDAGFSSRNVTASLTVNGNTLTADFAGDLPPGLYSVYITDLVIRDSCGGTTTFGGFQFRTAFSSNVDSGTLVNIYCET